MFRSGAKGIAFTLCWAGEERHVEAGVLGLFNVDNMIGAIGMMLASGRGLDDVIRVAERLAPPPGRLQKITHPDEPMGVVDYCHTPDAIEKALHHAAPCGGSPRRQALGDRGCRRQPRPGQASDHGRDRGKTLRQARCDER